VPRLTGYQLLTAATAIATLVLIAIGSLVRTSGSGLGCPDWPTCQGAWLPPFERTAIIEYSHRTTAAVVSVLLVATLVETLRSHRADRALVRVVLLTIPLLVFQAWLGKVTVERELPPAVVTLHLATSLLLLAVTCAAAALARLGVGREAIADRERAGVLRVVLVGAVVTYVVLLTGAYVVKAGASTACISWPGCSAAPIPFVDGGVAQHIQWLHRIVAVGGALAVGAVAVAVQSAASAGPRLRRAAAWLLALYGAQVLVGAANIWTNFSGAARIAHLAVGAAIWALLVLMAVAGRYRAASESSAAVAARVARV
jgi:heme A synthase